MSITTSNTVVTAPASEPVTTAEAKSHLRVTISTDDTLIGEMITVARDMLENYTCRAFINTTFDYFLDAFPSPRFEHGRIHNGRIIEPPVSNLSSVTSVKYYDTQDALQTLASSEYLVDSSHEPGRIVEAYETYWPDTSTRINTVEVRYIAGYGATAADVPETLKLAIKMLVNHYYDNRSAYNYGDCKLDFVPMGIKSLIYRYKIQKLS